MKRVVTAVTYALLAATTLLAQTTAKKTVQSAGLGKPEAASNEETNIRAYIELLRTDVRKEKSAIMGEVMQFDSAQAAKFWPIYQDFEKELTTLGDQALSVVKEYADEFDALTDGVADKLANQVLSIEQQRNALKKKYYDRFKEAMGAITAARFLQVENQLERLVDLQITAQLPVISGR